MANSEGKIKVRVTPKKRPIKPALGKGSGGLLTAKIIATVKKNKK